MPREVIGVASILKGARLICRIVGRFGVARLAEKTTPEFAAAVSTLVAACHALEAIDDQPYTVDGHAPFGDEDSIPA